MLIDTLKKMIKSEDGVASIEFIFLSLVMILITSMVYGSLLLISYSFKCTKVANDVANIMSQRVFFSNRDFTNANFKPSYFNKVTLPRDLWEISKMMDLSFLDELDSSINIELFGGNNFNTIASAHSMPYNSCGSGTSLNTPSEVLGNLRFKSSFQSTNKILRVVVCKKMTIPFFSGYLNYKYTVRGVSVLPVSYQ